MQQIFVVRRYRKKGGCKGLMEADMSTKKGGRIGHEEPAKLEQNVESSTHLVVI